MAKKDFFKSFENNLSFNNGENADTAQLEKVSSNGNQKSGTKKSIPRVKLPKAAAIPKQGPSKVSATKVTTFRIEVDLLQKVKAIAYWERQKIQDVLDEALSDYVNNYAPSELNKAVKAYAKSEEN